MLGVQKASEALLARLAHSHHRLRDNSDERMLELMQAAGFSDAKTTLARRMLLGRVAFYQAAAA